MKRILSLFLSVVLCLSLCLTAMATGDPNIDTGGGGLGGGSTGNIWYGDSGVRVTIVDAETRSPITTPVDLIKQPGVVVWYANMIIHFGKVAKMQYNAGNELTPEVGGYDYILPAQALPQIIATNGGMASITAIKSYFCDEQVLRGICGYTGFNYDMLISGHYKLVIEPLAAFLYNNRAYVMTATEAGLYDQSVNGDLRNKMAPLTHKNLPLALFLETADLGYPAWTGTRSSNVSDSDIISSLGIGIVRFTDEVTPPEPTEYEYEYRVDTDVITSIEVTGGQSDPDNPALVEFVIEGTTYTVDNVYYPDGDSQLAWVKWHTPSEPCVCTIRVSVQGAAWMQSIVTANIVDLDGNDPPNPVADDRNDSFRLELVPNNPQETSATWGIWSPWWQEYWVWIENWEKCWHSEWIDTGHTEYCPDDCTSSHGYWDYWYHWVDNGWWEDQGWWEFDYNEYSASLTATMEISPDSLSPSATATTMKSGYGIQEKVTSRVTTTQGSAVTAAQSAVTYFPEFGYDTYWRLLKPSISGRNTTFSFKDNPYSTYERPTHFTPIWYPDGSYLAYTWLLDCWTPVGMLSMNLTDSVRISGDLWEEWHIAPSK